MSFDSRLSLIRELETRTERVYHEVNGNPGVSTPGGRQLLSEANEHVGLFTYEERLEASRSVAERIAKLTEGDDDE